MQAMYEVREIGHDREPVVIIDNFSADAEALRRGAVSRPYAPIAEYYPGIRAPIDGRYLKEREKLLEAVLNDVFRVDRNLQIVESNYSIVTTPPLGLKQPQRLPHVDSFNHERLAVLHYLCGPETGGTAFFRHRATGYEYLTDERYMSYGRVLEAEIADAGGVPRRYPDEDVPFFEKIAEVEARPNRVVIYRGNRFHSGVIPTGYTFDADPMEGRLTINTFLE